MKLLIAKWGNSLAVRLPSECLQQAGLREGDRLDLEVDPSGQIRLTPEQYFDKPSFLRRLRKLHDRRQPTEPLVEKMRQQERF